MARTKSKPGPPPRSCLTCQKRRKKCDLGRPSCERCLKGGFECLGYNGKNHENTQRKNVNPNRPPPSDTIPILGAEPTHSDAVNCDSGQPPTRLPPDNCQYVDRNQPALSIFGSALIYNIARTVSQDIDNQAIDDYNRSWPQNQSQLTSTNGHARLHRPLTVTKHLQTASSTRVGEDNLRTVVQALYTSIPLSIDATQATREGHFEQIIHEFQLQRANYWLMSLPVPVTTSHQQKSFSYVASR
ncbi:unnamed protein product [Rhizoctonia solani]|uniref:Zn(2)-C6 fungal-type domain-containing protein n=1 Tax=Rhizoctonia solani TaxID=456999 RepID=A0A8H3B3Q0_9AGAM|nr:unnamed protein product [Rhizoctonia solani]